MNYSQVIQITLINIFSSLFSPWPMLVMPFGRPTWVHHFDCQYKLRSRGASRKAWHVETRLRPCLVPCQHCWRRGRLGTAHGPNMIRSQAVPCQAAMDFWFFLFFFFFYICEPIDAPMSRLMTDLFLLFFFSSILLFLNYIWYYYYIIIWLNVIRWMDGMAANSIPPFF